MGVNILDAVKIKKDIPENGIKEGMIGAIVQIYFSPDEAYEVEFCNDIGQTIAQLLLKRNEFTILRPYCD